jgi:hypothetical protein
MVLYWPLSELRVLRLARVEGMRDYLLLQGSTAKADADAGVDAWRDLLPFLDDAIRRTGHEVRRAFAGRLLGTPESPASIRPRA